jgi:oleate hydratase
MTKLLSLVPSKTNLKGTLLDDVRRFETIERPQPQTAALSRALKLGPSGPEIVETKSLSIGAKNRMNLVKIMLERESTLGSKSIEDIMDEDFFGTTFWMLWTTECVLSPYERTSSPA